MHSQYYVSKLSFKYDGFEDKILLSNNFRRGALTASPDWVVGGEAHSSNAWTKGSWATDASGNSWRLCVRFDACAEGIEGSTLTLKVDKEEEEDRNDGTSLFTFILRGADGSAVKESQMKSSKISFKCTDFVALRRFLDKDNGILARGALHIDLVIQPELKVNLPSVSSQNALLTNMLRMFDMGYHTDVSFEFPSSEMVLARAGLENSYLFAHKLVLLANSPELASFFFEDEEERSVETMKPKVVVEGTSYAVFKHLLRYIYGGGLPDEDFMVEHAKEIIDAADKYSVVGLKLEAEAILVSSHSINTSNVVEYILFADAHNCALLKEYAMSYFVSRSEDIMRSKSFSDLALSNDLMRELWSATGRGGVAATSDGNDLRRVPVFKLLQMLAEKGLDVDGSKEMLVARLESS